MPTRSTNRSRSPRRRAWRLTESPSNTRCPQDVVGAPGAVRSLIRHRSPVSRSGLFQQSAPSWQHGQGDHPNRSRAARCELVSASRQQRTLTVGGEADAPGDHPEGPVPTHCGHRGERVTSKSQTLAQKNPEAADVSKIMIAAALLMSSTLVGCQSGLARDCLSGRREALVTGGFSGLLECSGEDVTLNFVGTTGSGYTVYDYRYRLMSAAVMHGGQRLVIFKGAAYVGQYALSPPPYSTASVRASDVYVRTISEDAVLDFSNGAPSQAFLDGHVVDLYR